MTILVAGANGATGRHLVDHLLRGGHKVRAIVRNPAKLPALLRDRKDLSVIQGSILDLSDAEMADLVRGCDAVASCLGHNLTLKGVYGHPRRLVTDAVQRLCKALEASDPDGRKKFLLMNTSGNRNRDLPERISFAQRLVIGLLRLVLPPHVDNEQAADYLRTRIGQSHPQIEWAAIRPDGLIDEDEVTDYEIHPSPVRSPIFNSGKTSRINVGHFMSDLITNEGLWKRWKGQMPVIYNTAFQ